MENHLLEIDHPMIKVASLENAARSFERLGFQLSPIGVFDAFGCRNQCILFTPSKPGIANFIELMEVSDPGKLPPAMSFLEGPLGVKTLVHSTPDIESAREHMISIGYSVPPVQTVQRSWSMPDGSHLWFEFRLAIPECGQSPLMFNAYDTTTLDNYLRPDLRAHPNTSRTMVGLTVVADRSQFALLVEQLRRLYMCGVEVRVSDHHVTLRPGGTVLHVMSPGCFERRYRDTSFAVSSPVDVRVVTLTANNLSTAHKYLNGNTGFSHRDEDTTSIAVHDAGGLILEFVSQIRNESTG